MFIIICQVLVFVFIVEAFSIDDFHNDVTSEMIEDGKNQYQLIRERGKLPKYGECWTSSVEYIHEGCRYLNEEVQSDIALRITNCFLEMSGHETYNCHLDKKPNLRGICITSMSDRAFNVYTEFYTHAQNICWFLRGQVWQERISERTFQVGEQLKNSVNQQELLLKQQKESLELQEQLLKYGQSLEKIINDSKHQAENVMEEIKISTLKHQHLLGLMTTSLSGLQSWLIGEMSWFDSLVFYISGAIIIVVVTSTTRTNASRLPLLFILSLNIFFERIICDFMSQGKDQNEIYSIHQDLYYYIWWCRQFTITFCIVILLTQSYFYKDYNAVNNLLLQKIQEQNSVIKEELEKLKSPIIKSNFDEKFNIITESPCSRRSVETETIKPVLNTFFKRNSDTNSETSKNSISTTSSVIESPINVQYGYLNGRSSVSTSREALFLNKLNCNNFIHKSTDSLSNVSTTSSVRRYNLRNRTETPIPSK